MSVKQRSSSEPSSLWKPAILALLIGVTLVIIPFATAIAYYRLSSYLDEKKYRALLLESPGVREVESYLNYEGWRHADVRLENGGFLSLSELDEASFTKTKFIHLIVIGDQFISCRDGPDSRNFANGFNIIEALGRSPASPPIENIADLVSHYAKIYDVVKDTVPGENSRLKPFRVRGAVSWCRVLPSSGQSTERLLMH